MADMALFASMLTEAGLMEKPFSAMTGEEVQAVFTACYSAGAMRDEVTIFDNPYINEHGLLVIPFGSDPKYHHWKRSGQTVFDTLRELGASEEVFRKYTRIDDLPF